jgi:GNAT superfamily N-acetyltransferase
MDVVRVDPADGQALRAWHEAYDEGRSAGREAPPRWALPELEVQLKETGPAYRTEAYAAVVAGATVGGALIELALLDNLRLVEFELAVTPTHRRRGAGSALYDAVVGVARAEGRDNLLTEVVEPYRGRGPAEGVPFAEKRGFTCRSRDVHQLLDLPVDAARLDGLARHADPGDYRLHTWSGVCPGDLVGGYVALRSRFMSEIPMGDMEYEPETWDADRLRAEETKWRAQSRTWFTTVAVAPGGDLVGHTLMVLPGHDPAPVYQGDTMVLPGHRGHRLGLALKVANLRAMIAAQPGRRVVHTWNAEENGPMVAVNEAMGFRPVELTGVYQRDL